MTKLRIGGQALIEGVMFRTKNKISIAIRKPNKKIALFKIKFRQKRIKFPILRGLFNLWEMLKFGTKALSLSAQIQQKKQEKISGKEFALAIAISILFSILIFIFLPYWLAKLIFKQGFALHFFDGIFRILIFFIYIFSTSFLKDVRRLFEYHGAEHMVANCYESGQPLKFENILKQRKEHLRCGTSFLFIVFILAIFVFSIVRIDHWFGNIVLRIFLIPIIAGTCYEIFGVYARTGNKILKIFIYPGLLFQLLTTRWPKRNQIEVALAALKNLIRK